MSKQVSIQRIGAATSLALAAALASTGAQAVIIYSGPLNLAIPNTAAGLYVNVIDGSTFSGPATFPVLGGPGAEAAMIALQAVGVAAVVCARAAPDLAELEPVYGLPFVVAPEAAGQIAEGAVVRLDLERGRLEAGGFTWLFSPLAPATLLAARRAQLLARMRRVVEDEGYAE
ncbi:MAG: hypothetical protein HGA45_35735 [Chloroflexales bacterium]|nr:hypothetical protein [Chloroflexales bacterium]